MRINPMDRKKNDCFGVAPEFKKMKAGRMTLNEERKHKSSRYSPEDNLSNQEISSCSNSIVLT